MKEKQPVPAKGLVPGSHDEPSLYEGVVVTGVSTDEKGKRRFKLALRDNPDHTWNTLPINETEENKYKKALEGSTR